MQLCARPRAFLSHSESVATAEPTRDIIPVAMKIYLVATFMLGLFVLPVNGDTPSTIDWRSELKRPEVQKVLAEYIVTHCIVVGPDDKEWQADHGKPRKVASIVCSED
jgi:hypothetical protein